MSCLPTALIATCFDSLNCFGGCLRGGLGLRGSEAVPACVGVSGCPLPWPLASFSQLRTFVAAAPECVFGRGVQVEYNDKRRSFAMVSMLGFFRFRVLGFWWPPGPWGFRLTNGPVRIFGFPSCVRGLCRCHRLSKCDGFQCCAGSVDCSVHVALASLLDLKSHDVACYT